MTVPADKEKPRLRIFAARPRRWVSAEFPRWYAAHDLVMDEAGTYAIRVWSEFDNGWNWLTIREPVIVCDGRVA